LQAKYYAFLLFLAQL
jgi:hypothetical protein